MYLRGSRCISPNAGANHGNISHEMPIPQLPVLFAIFTFKNYFQKLHVRATVKNGERGEVLHGSAANALWPLLLDLYTEDHKTVMLRNKVN